MRESAVLLVVLAACESPRHVETSSLPRLPALEAPPIPDAGVEPPPPEPPPRFVDLAEAVPGVVLEVRYATADNFTGAPLPGYAPNVLWVYEDTAWALAEVQDEFAANGMRLRIYDAYRPARASVAMVDWAIEHGRIDLVTQGYVGRRSNHARGNTVDLTVDGPDGRPLDMGTDWDAFTPASHYRGVEGEAMRNRRRLRRAMQRVGFVPYAREWWHFSLPSQKPRLDVPYPK